MIFKDRRRWIEETINPPPLHEILSYQPCEGQESCDAALGGMGHAQEQEGDKCDGDLNAHGVLGSTEKVADFEGLLDPAEEQFDVPAALVEFGDLIGRSIKIIGDNTQDLAGLGLDPDLAHRVLERVLAGLGLPCRQQSDAVGKHRRALRHLVLGRHQQRCIGLQTGDEAASRGMEFSPPAIVVVAEVEDIGRTGSDRHGFGDGDVVDIGRGQFGEARALAVWVIDNMQLGPVQPEQNRAQSALSEFSRNPVESTRYTASATLPARPRSHRPISSDNNSVNTAQERLALASAKVERDNSLAPR